MKITVIGATGGTGRLVVDQALARGYEVRAFVRNPQTLPNHPHLSVIQGDLADTAALAGAIAGSDALLCCLGVHEKEKCHRDAAPFAAHHSGHAAKRGRALDFALSLWCRSQHGLCQLLGQAGL